MPYLALLRTWTHVVVVEIPTHYCSCLSAQVGDPNTSLITPKGVCMLLQGQPSLLPPTARICLSRDHSHHQGLDQTTGYAMAPGFSCRYTTTGPGHYLGSLGYEQGFHVGARAEHTKRVGQALQGQDLLAPQHGSLSAWCSVTAARGQLKGSLPGSVAAPSAGLAAPRPGVLPAVLGGPAIHRSGLQCSSCAWAAGPASVPAPLGAVWYRRVEAGTATGAGGGRKEEELAPNRIHEGAPTFENYSA